MKVFLKDGILTVSDDNYLKLMRSFTDLSKATTAEVLTALTPTEKTNDNEQTNHTNSK